MKTYELVGIHGSGMTPCTVLVAAYNGKFWYVVEGGTIVNCTNWMPEDERVDVECLTDVDCFTWSKPIESLEELEQAINS